MLSSLKYFACQHSLVSQCRTSLHYKDPLPRLFNSTVASVSEHENIMHIWPIMMHAVSCKHHESCVHKMHKPWFREQFATTVTLMSQNLFQYCAASKEHQLKSLILSTLAKINNPFFFLLNTTQHLSINFLHPILQIIQAKHALTDKA